MVHRNLRVEIETVYHLYFLVFRACRMKRRGKEDEIFYYIN